MVGRSGLQEVDRHVDGELVVRQVQDVADISKFDQHVIREIAPPMPGCRMPITITLSMHQNGHADVVSMRQDLESQRPGIAIRIEAVERHGLSRYRSGEVGVSVGASLISKQAVHQDNFVVDAAAHAVVGIFLCAATGPGLETAVDTDDGGAELMGTEATAGRVGKPIATGIGSGVGAGFLNMAGINRCRFTYDHHTAVPIPGS